MLTTTRRDDRPFSNSDDSMVIEGHADGSTGTTRGSASTTIQRFSDFERQEPTTWKKDITELTGVEYAGVGQSHYDGE